MSAEAETRMRLGGTKTGMAIDPGGQGWVHQTEPSGRSATISRPAVLTKTYWWTPSMSTAIGDE